MRFDGASNAVGHGIGAVLVSPKGKYFPLRAKLCFDCTNNIAEYEACVMGLQMAIEMHVKRIEVYGDSALVINQLEGNWERRNSKLFPYQEYINGLKNQFEYIKF